MEAELEAIRVLQVIAIVVGGFFVGKLMHSLLVRGFRRFASLTPHSLDDMVLEYIENPLKATIIVFLVYLFSFLSDGFGDVQSAMTKYANAILILLFAFLCAEVVGAILRWYYEQGQKKTHFKFDLSLLPFARKASRVLILFFGGLLALGAAGIDINGILTVTSVVALILGLASQETLANIFAGMALQLDRPYTYGDFLKMPTGETVRLRKIGTRSARLVDPDGNIMVLSNSELARTRITNLSKPRREFKVVVPIELPWSIDLADFERFVRREIVPPGESSLKHPPVSIFLESVKKDFRVVQIGFWHSDFSEATQWRDFINRKTVEYFTQPQPESGFTQKDESGEKGI